MADDLEEYLRRKRAAAAPAPTGDAGDDELATYMAQKRGTAPAAPPPEQKIAPGGLTGVITGQTAPAPPTAPDTRLAPTVANRFYRGAGLGLGPLFGAVIDTGISQIPGVRNVAEAFNSIGENGGHPGLSPLTNPNLTYQQRLDEYRARDDAQAGAHPIAARAAELTGNFVTGSLGAALAPAAAATAAGAGASTAGVLGRAAATGAGYGAMGAAADTREPTLLGKAKDVAIGAGVGALVGGAAEGAAALLTRRAAERVAKDITRDIVEGSGEHGAATPTARKIVQQDKDDIVKVVTSDGDVAKAVRMPAKKGLPTIKAKLAEEGGQLAPRYAVVDEAVGGVRVGDYVDHLEAAAAKLRATARGQDAQVAEQLEKAAARVRNGADWGARTKFDPNVEVQPGVTAGQQIALMERVAQDPQQAAAARAEIARVRAYATHKGYDPDAIVPTRQLRANVTDLQSTAYDGLGGINGTNAYQKASEVAHVGENFLRAHLDAAEAASPAAAQAVGEIRAINPRFSALKNIEKAMTQRAVREETGGKSLATTIVHGGGLLEVGRSLASGHPGRAAAELATAYALPKVARAVPPVVNRAMAGLMLAAKNGSVTAGLVQQAIEAGVPRATALRLAGLAGDYAPSLETLQGP